MLSHVSTCGFDHKLELRLIDHLQMGEIEWYCHVKSSGSTVCFRHFGLEYVKSSSKVSS